VKRPRDKALVWVVRPGAAGPEALLLQRPVNRGGGWHPVTGKAGRDESPELAAARESEEETGLTGPLIDLRWAHAFETSRGPMIEHCFLMRVGGDAEPRLSEEHVAHRWLSLEEAWEALEWDAHRQTLRLVRDALAKDL
jgi:8-oxo-dGTP pyrophosphatase MutT (NUDIX family)